MASTLAKAGNQNEARQLVDQARQSAVTVRGSFEKVTALCTVAVVMVQEKMDGANQLFQEAQDAAFQIADPNDRASALKFISGTLSSAGMNDVALKTFQEALAINAKTSNTDAGAREQQALLLARAGRPDDALTIMYQLASSNSTAGGVGLIVQALCASGKCDAALAAVNRIIPDSSSAAVALCSAASGLVAANQKDAASSVLSFLQSATLYINDPANRSQALNCLGQGWLQVGENGQGSL